MFKRIATACFALMFLVGCQQAEQGEQEMAAQEESGEMEMAAATFNVEVTNPMPHAMVVYQMTDMGETVLDTVDANATAMLTVERPENMTLDLKAQDLAETHSVTGQVMLREGETASWTVAKTQPEEKMKTEGQEQT